jgi:hypothetical protein
VKDSASQLRSATRRAKSDVANKLVSMFLHELSRKVSRKWPIKVDGEDYEKLVRALFGNRCPYCCCDLVATVPVVEHLDSMNRYRAGLHVPGNTLIACRRCNNEKRRDDSLKSLSLAKSGWESFLTHDGTRCTDSCRTCRYWKSIWPEDSERRERLNQNSVRIRSFRQNFAELEQLHPMLAAVLPTLLTKLYTDCQVFAESEINSLLQKVDQISATQR